MKGKEITMTSGSLYKNIFIFSVPLMLSNMLQVLFNISDIAAVGRFAGAAALGEVGSCTILVSLFTGLLIGMGGGINAVAARYMGARDTEKLKKAVHSAFLISVIFGLLVMTIGLAVVKEILVLLDTKNELLDGAVLYIRVYLLGTPALALYNYGNGILSAAGDSKRPLFYLSAAGVVNIALNLFFVIVFNMGVLGVALASIISQYLSAFLIIMRLIKCKKDYSLTASQMRIDLPVSKNIAIIGISAGLQNAIFALANLFIQSAVNSFDTIMVEGNSAAANADTLIYDIMAAFYVACTSFMAQNYGAGKKERVMQSYKISLLYSFAVAAVAGVLLLVFGREFLSLFTTEEAVIEAGIKRLTIMASAYCISAFMDCSIAASRGLGETVVPTIAVVIGSCVLRIVWIYTIFAYFNTIPSLYLLYPFSWAVTAVFEIAYFRIIYRKKVLSLPDNPATKSSL